MKRNEFEEKIRIAMIKSGNKKMTEMGELLDMSAANVAVKLKKNNLREAEMRKMAAVLGYNVEITLVSKKTGDRI